MIVVARGRRLAGGPDGLQQRGRCAGPWPASATPVVSAVGHERDVTLCDLVADVRVSTPTAAAAAVVPSREALETRLGDAAAAIAPRPGARRAGGRAALGRRERRAGARPAARAARWAATGWSAWRPGWTRPSGGPAPGRPRASRSRAGRCGAPWTRRAAAPGRVERAEALLGAAVAASGPSRAATRSCATRATAR